MEENKDIKGLLEKINNSNEPFENNWFLMVMLLLFWGFSNGKKENPTTSININLIGDDLDV